MNDADRFRLLGQYRTPRFRYGQAAFCKVSGKPAEGRGYAAGLLK